MNGQICLCITLEAEVQKCKIVVRRQLRPGGGHFLRGLTSLVEVQQCLKFRNNMSSMSSNVL